jgi:hypothetical protein
MKNKGIANNQYNDLITIMQFFVVVPDRKPSIQPENCVSVVARRKATRQSAENSRVRPRELTRRAKSKPGFRKE